jgi:CRISPR-associated protein Csb3
MTHPEPTCIFQVDARNTGQFFACCGLLELAHRLWPGAEGWFSTDATRFNVLASAADADPLTCIVKKLAETGIEGELSKKEREELDELESKKRKLAKEGGALPNHDDERRSSLGKRRREGALTLHDPFGLRVAWWQEEGDDIPKTFAGKQEVLRMAQAMLARLPEAVQDDSPLEYRCLLQAVSEELPETNHGSGNRRGSGTSKVEPFYFDARRFAHALDVGFSLDVQEHAIRASAAPLTELLALIGLQRFRPAAADQRWRFDYWTWSVPLSPVIAAGIVCGAAAVPGRKRYRFPLRFRDDQKRYKAFGFAAPIGGNT